MDAPNVAGLVYIAAFGLDQGESPGALLSQGPLPAAFAHMFTDKQGFDWSSEDDFVNHFAADVDPAKAKVMHAVQQALAASAFTDVMGVPAWKTLPSWYLVAADDQAIPPDAERLFASRMGATAIEIPSSHVTMVSHPGGSALSLARASACRGPRPEEIVKAAGIGAGYYTRREQGRDRGPRRKSRTPWRVPCVWMRRAASSTSAAGSVRSVSRVRPPVPRPRRRCRR
jgi:hypothetical protein